MKKILSELFLTILYLTPVGYILSLLKLYSGERTPGVYVFMGRDEPIRVMVKENPLPLERLHWFLNGVVLIVQTLVIFINNLGGEWGHTYAWIAFIFGVVNAISSIFPKFDWNGGIFKSVKISVIWILLIVSLILITVGYDLLIKSK